jgi:hypothetical protein
VLPAVLLLTLHPRELQLQGADVKNEDQSTQTPFLLNFPHSHHAYINRIIRRPQHHLSKATQFILSFN